MLENQSAIPNPETTPIKIAENLAESSQVKFERFMLEPNGIYNIVTKNSSISVERKTRSDSLQFNEDFIAPVVRNFVPVFIESM